MANMVPPHAPNTERVIGEEDPEPYPAAILYYAGRAIPISSADAPRVRGAITAAAKDITSAVQLDDGLRVVQIGPGIAAVLEWTAAGH